MRKAIENTARKLLRSMWSNTGKLITDTITKRPYHHELVDAPKNCATVEK